MHHSSNCLTVGVQRQSSHFWQRHCPPFLGGPTIIGKCSRPCRLPHISLKVAPSIDPTAFLCLLPVNVLSGLPVCFNPLLKSLSCPVCNIDCDTALLFVLRATYSNLQRAVWSSTQRLLIYLCQALCSVASCCSCLLNWTQGLISTGSCRIRVQPAVRLCVTASPEGGLFKQAALRIPHMGGSLHSHGPVPADAASDTPSHTMHSHHWGVPALSRYWLCTAKAVGFCTITRSDPSRPCCYSSSCSSSSHRFESSRACWDFWGFWDFSSSRSYGSRRQKFKSR